MRRKGFKMPSLTVLVANQPRLVRELVLAVLRDAPQVEVVGEVEDYESIRGIVQEVQPDFLLLTLEEHSDRPNAYDAILETAPTLKILAIAPDRDESVLLWKQGGVRARRLKSSEQGILDVFREAFAVCDAESSGPRAKAS